jgi:hypothetical protein
LPWIPPLRLLQQPIPGDWARLVAQLDATIRPDLLNRNQEREISMTQVQPQTFLHIGCGPKRKDKTTRGFNTDCAGEKIR